jgi:hypothetical protein
MRRRGFSVRAKKKIVRVDGMCWLEPGEVATSDEDPRENALLTLRWGRPFMVDGQGNRKGGNMCNVPSDAVEML